MIHLKEVITAINSTDHKGNGLEFSIEFVTCNKQKKTGGRRIKLEQAVKMSNYKKLPLTVRNVYKGRKVRHVNHLENLTIDILDILSIQPYRIHPVLILFFNGERIRL